MIRARKLFFFSVILRVCDDSMPLVWKCQRSVLGAAGRQWAGSKELWPRPSEAGAGRHSARRCYALHLCLLPAVEFLDKFSRSGVVQRPQGARHPLTDLQLRSLSLPSPAHPPPHRAAMLGCCASACKTGQEQAGMTCSISTSFSFKTTSCQPSATSCPTALSHTLPLCPSASQGCSAGLRAKRWPRLRDGALQEW